ncbi:Acetylornithine deacetylase/Succinyl-diaminopimelate desuccinylase [Granulicella rosea]|uniref:Acetylornithine deacetylase/Succinyl-diaminopimelate desuccinylase n=1 Tax=Granulicella rosea TaxID=474952 RepID=A0A239H394_9BACT|nr:M20/M25/M40 family metallo-hydrolase [Granulicella rosea]SNS75847.1 Acetylornithine deacetylase/Succinyl-diaminopimelate desuccinylase [Granulicella rosea]
MRRATTAFCLPLALSAVSFAQTSAAAAPRLPEQDAKLAREIFQQLIEINTTDSVGNVTTAANAMQKRLLDAGFPAADAVVLGPNARKGNLVARYRGRPGSKLKPVLIIAHLDVVEASRSDWTTDPFQFVEKDGYFYGRGTQDIKEADASLIESFIRMRREGFVPDRDIILALTADEEGGKSNGVEWLIANHRDLVDAEFVLNPDAGGPEQEKGRAVNIGVEASEKLYADYVVSAANPGGHSSLPRPDNAIYHVADALGRLEKTTFPLETNEVTRAYFAASAKLQTGQLAEDLKAVSGPTPDAAAAARLSKDITYNSLLHTTCVATMMNAGHAPNALPNAASANVNCRIEPGHSQEEIRLELVKIFADPTLKVQYMNDAREIFDHGSDRKSMAPPPLLPAVFEPLKVVVNQMWPGIPVIPRMETGASDSIYTMAAGIPSYGFSGMGVDRDDDRAHGRDERIRVVDYFTGVEFQYLYLKALTSR